MIHVLAIVTTKPGQRDRVLEAFRANVPNVHAEEGCLEYQAAVDVTPALGFQAEFGADTFVVVEKWTSLAALDAHSKAPHMVDYGVRTKDLVASRAIHVLSPA